MDLLDQEDEQNHEGGVSRFGAPRRLKKRCSSHQQLVMDCVSVGGGNGVTGEGPSEETVPLPDYERLSQSARLADDPDPWEGPQQKKPPPPLATPPQQQRPAAWKLLDYVRSRNKSAGGGGCSAESDVKSSDGSEDGAAAATEEERQKKEKKKKRSSWLPDPERRWPVQGFY